MVNKIKTPFDPKGEIFHWGPIPGKFLYVSIFVDVNYKYFRTRYHENWSETLFLFKNDRMFWINNTNDLEAAGLRAFLIYLLPIKIRKNIYKEWKSYVKRLLKLQKEIDKINLEILTNKQLRKLWHSFNVAYINFWVTGTVPELANYGSEKYLKEKLKSVIKNEGDLSNAMEVLTAPTHLSFYQEEEVDLVKNKNLKNHQQKYFWLKNSYAGTEVLPMQFFAERKSKINKNIETEMKDRIKEVVANKKIIQKKYFFTTEIINIGKAISEGIGWQDERKKYIFMALHYQDLMLKEVASRFDYGDQELHRAWYFEIEEIIDKKNLHNKLEKRKEGFGVQFFNTCKELNSYETENFWKLYQTKSDQNLTEIKGIVACKGKITKTRGSVHILLDPKNVESFKDGEILVAPMSSPEYIFAMKKAGAVITDTGGLTSHAAIVSRELNIPCIVGARGSTILFKNNDIVEIDTSNGTVKIIK